mgnify:FL=1
MSLYRHLHASLGSAHKIVLAISTFVMATVIPVMAKADVIDAPRVGNAPRVGLATSHVSLIAVVVLVAVVGFIMIKRRNR